MTGPASLRLRAALMLSALVAALWLAAAAGTVRLLTGEMDEVFDAALQETGQRILQLAVVDILNREEEGITQTLGALDPHDEFFTYVVRDDRGRVLLTSDQAAVADLPQFDQPGFHQTDTHRLYQEEAVQGTVILTIAEPLQHRRQVWREVALSLGLPLIFVLPLSVLSIFLGLQWGLRPLSALRDLLARRDARDFSILPVAGQPAELQPITGAMNQLFTRLDAAFEAERSFAAHAAHELRTPLAGAIMQLQRLRRKTTEPDTIATATEVEAALKRLMNLSERLMQLARAEGARLEATTPHDLRQVMDLVVADHRRAAPTRALEVAMPDQPVLSRLDPDAAGIILRNLIGNALTHGQGPVRVTLDSAALLRVENDCPAIPPADLSRLTQRFQRGDGAAEGGSGLGLAIVSRMAERAGLALKLTSPLPGTDRGFAAEIRLSV